LESHATLLKARLASIKRYHDRLTHKLRLEHSIGDGWQHETFLSEAQEHARDLAVENWRSENAAKHLTGHTDKKLKGTLLIRAEIQQDVLSELRKLEEGKGGPLYVLNADELPKQRYRRYQWLYGFAPKSKDEWIEVVKAAGKLDAEKRVESYMSDGSSATKPAALVPFTGSVYLQIPRQTYKTHGKINSDYIIDKFWDFV
jgi:hypothetical protein